MNQATSTTGLVPRLFSQTVSDSDRLFWLLNAGGWISLSVVTYVSLSLPYDQLQFAYIAHNILQSVLGFLLSIPLRQAFKATWNWAATTRVTIAIALILVVATVWAAMRLQLLIVIAGEADLWDDFGGFLFPSLFVFLAWVSLYHLVKYAQLLQNERESTLVLEASRRQEAFKLVSAESAAREAQLKLLRYQLNPHFLFNTLNSIASLVSARRSDDAQSMIGELSTFLRFSLESDRNVTLPLRDEIEALDLYLRIEQVRFSDRLVVEQDIDPRALAEQVPSLLLQPLVENAIKHAIGRAEEGGRILITAKLRDTELVITVEDSGSGTGEEQPQLNQLFESPGFGLRSTAERLENLYGDAFSFNAGQSRLGGLKLALHLPTRGRRP
ncbi:putative regulator of cell autolysis [gamma proteobacterium HIMB55]|nr:putative regulator of cell autolysis [gamma proteobacterium HIMB55]